RAVCDSMAADHTQGKVSAVRVWRRELHPPHIDRGLQDLRSGTYTGRRVLRPSSDGAWMVLASGRPLDLQAPRRHGGRGAIRAELAQVSRRRPIVLESSIGRRYCRRLSVLKRNDDREDAVTEKRDSREPTP